MNWTRRRLLFGAGAAALVTAGGIGGLALQGTVLRQPQRPLQVLEPVPFSILAAVVETLCPPIEGAPDPVEIGVAEDVDAFLATCSPGVAREVTLALGVVENAALGLLFDQTLRRPFTACEPPARVRVLEGFRDSALPVRRTLFKALLKLTTSTYYGHPATFAFSGYVPRVYARAGE